ncbi:MAG: amino acid permease [Caulobacteraceae bacterium]|nr:amino acid permease [Caulobacteraceae bacterium]
MSFWTRRKAIDTITDQAPEHRLRPTLSWPHLLALGVGAIVGTGIYTLIGVGAGLAGPAVILSFLIAGAVCACAALSYAELATMMPAAGSAYTYSYAVLGEFLAWIVGWSLILEYTVVCAAVAVGWSAHATEFLGPHGLLPHALLVGPAEGGVINLPAVAITFAVAALLIRGMRESAGANAVLVAVKLAALAAFVVIAARAFDLRHFTPFMPQGFFGHAADGSKVGVMPAASIIFFAFYGFDAISTAAEETRNPGRDLTIGIIGSMALCVVIYMAVALAALGAVPTDAFARSAAPLVYVLDRLNQPLAAGLVAGAAVVALPTVILAFMYGQSRIFFVMARDGLLPHGLSRVSAKTGAPGPVTLVTAAIAAAIAGFLPLKDIAALANAGTLCAFIAVAVCMVLLRIREPDRPRVFRAPLWWLIGPAGALGCLYLFTTLPQITIALFFVWNGVGVLTYLLYGRRASLLARAG